MFWFTNQLDAPTEFIGLHFSQERGAYVLRVLHPDGSQETRMFVDKDACVEQTMALREELIECGWWPWRETARRSPHES